MTQVVLTSLLLAGLLMLCMVSAERHWGYPDMEKEEEFPHWGGICDDGNRQSPINLSLKGALKGNFPELQLKNYDKIQESTTLVNNGHSVKLSGFSSGMKLSGGPLLNEYVVEQIHLHWWSEHTIDNIRYPLEAHIVHRNIVYGNMTEAVKHKNGIVVVAILYHVSLKNNLGIEKITENLELIREASNINKPVDIQLNVKIRALFPEMRGYMTYAGSLTTPTCAESVTWIVLLDTFPVTLEQVKKFRQIEQSEGKKLSDNYRQIQKSHNRAVVVVLDDQDDNENDSSAAPVLYLSSSLCTIASSLLFVHFL